MQVRVNAPTIASAESLRQRLASVFGANQVVVDGSRTGVRLRTVSDALETVTGALNAIEHWLEVNDLDAAEVVLDHHMYLIARHGRAGDSSPGAPTAADPPGRRFRVLIVDDDPGIRTLCAASLSRAGVEVLEAENGGRGLERALEDRPDLVLLDVNMPILDGFALAERLREDERTRHVPFIFLTGELGHETRAQADALGAAAFVSKPFDARAVAALVVTLLGRLRGSAALATRTL
jgi:CheY-like chemotaxis protein